MQSAPYRSSFDRRYDSPRRRGRALLLALALHALAIVGLILFAPIPSALRKVEHELKAFQVPSQVDAEGSKKPEPRKKVTPEKKKAAAAGAPPTPRPPVPPAAPVVDPPPNMVLLSRDAFAAADIGKMARPVGKEGTAGTQSGQDSASVVGPGDGPGGQRLYNAEWYVEPTHAELAYYLPGGRAPPGWGMIACRTIEDFRVDDCQQIGESPPGSGLSRALRQAAWQFRVRPPRVGGKSMVGAWVRIRFDFTEKKAN